MGLFSPFLKKNVNPHYDLDIKECNADFSQANDNNGSDEERVRQRDGNRKRKTKKAGQKDK